MALLCQLSIDRDDQARLDAAEDKIETLLTILTEDREHLLPGIIERVADLGREIVPQLVARFDPHSPGWGMIRIAEAIEHLAYRHPGSCDAAISALIEALNDQQGDYLHEACAGALEAIGLAAVKPIILSRGEVAAIEKDESVVQMAPPLSPSPPRDNLNNVPAANRDQ